jgi:hypothetical protein
MGIRIICIETNKQNKNQMRKFRFVGDPKTYGWDNKPVVGEIYDATHKGYCVEDDFESLPIEEWPKNEGGQDWEEVTETEPEPKPLHKDTDLGYFAGLAMQGILANHSGRDSVYIERVVSDSIDCAKELIKQLDNETTRN